jgi:hypothetical protein
MTAEEKSQQIRKKAQTIASRLIKSGCVKTSDPLHLENALLEMAIYAITDTYRRSAPGTEPQ